MDSTNKFAIRSILLAPLLLLTSIGFGQCIYIDSFSIDQPVVSANGSTSPPGPGPNRSIVSNPNILGGEREIEVEVTDGALGIDAVVFSGSFTQSVDGSTTGKATVIWDGVDMSPGLGAINPVGLGGIDLTNSGLQNALELQLVESDMRDDTVTITVYSSSTNFSTFKQSVPITMLNNSFVLPYSEFSQGAEAMAGADFSNVGAITMSIEGTSLDLAVDFLRTTNIIRAELTDELIGDTNGNGLYDVGDTIRYSAKVMNPGDSTDVMATNTVFTIPRIDDVEILIGSVTTDRGSITSGNMLGNTTIGVNLGTLPDGDTAYIGFDVIVTAFPLNDTISVQGTVMSDQGDTFTDDPDDSTSKIDATTSRIHMPSTIITVTSDDRDSTYDHCEEIFINVVFDTIVTVTGTPQLTLETGTIDRIIDYAGGSGTNTLIFRYVVKAGDMTADLDYISSMALVLNGGVITDALGYNATLRLPLPGAQNSLGANKDIVINSVATPIVVDTILCQDMIYLSPGNIPVMSDTIGLLDTIQTATGCDAIFRINVQFDQLCSSMAISLNDPCNCANPRNARFNGVYYFNDTLVVNTMSPVDSILLVGPISNFYADTMGTLHVATTRLMPVMGNPLQWKLEYWRPTNIVPSAGVRTYSGPAFIDRAIDSSVFLPVCSEADCTHVDVPTLSEWGLMILGELMLIISIISLRQQYYRIPE